MKQKKARSSKFKDLIIPAVIMVAFWTLAFVLWQSNIFYLFNLGCLGTGIGLSIILARKKKPAGRRLAQLFIGIYMLGFLGILGQTFKMDAGGKELIRRR